MFRARSIPCRGPWCHRCSTRSWSQGAPTSVTGRATGWTTQQILIETALDEKLPNFFTTGAYAAT